MVPKNISKQHILKAIEQIDREGIPKRRESTKFNLSYKGKYYPPKLVVSIACGIATGRELPAEMFGGGDETNLLLQRKGFSIIGPFSGDIKPSRSGKALRIGRAIMELGCSMSEMKRRGNLWKAHKEVLASRFAESRGLYELRLLNIISEAEKNKLDILILPACTLVYSDRSDLSIYLKKAKNIRWLVTGLLRVTSSAKVKDFVETAEVWRDGRSVMNSKSDTVNFLQMDSIAAYVAISSTMLNVRSQTHIREIVECAPDNGSRIFAFDLGHHQYNGRYTMSLNSVLRAIKARTKQQSLVLLAFWKYFNGSIRFPWSFPNKSRWLAFERINLSVPERSESDYLDVFTVTL